jgi:hypothetical protein
VIRRRSLKLTLNNNLLSHVASSATTTTTISTLPTRLPAPSLTHLPQRPVKMPARCLCSSLSQAATQPCTVKVREVWRRKMWHERRKGCYARVGARNSESRCREQRGGGDALTGGDVDLTLTRLETHFHQLWPAVVSPHPAASPPSTRRCLHLLLLTAPPSATTTPRLIAFSRIATTPTPHKHGVT